MARNRVLAGPIGTEYLAHEQRQCPQWRIDAIAKATRVLLYRLLERLTRQHIVQLRARPLHELLAYSTNLIKQAFFW